MRKFWYLFAGALIFVLIITGAFYLLVYSWFEVPQQKEIRRIPLPAVSHESQVSLETALLNRRSIREFADEPLSLEEVSQLLWAAQGISDEQGHRTAPSAGGLYPLEIYLVAGEVDGLSKAVYRYSPTRHELLEVSRFDHRAELHKAALEQDPVKDAPAVIVFAAVYERSKGKYGQRAPQYVHIEAGSAAQNVYLQATALDLGTVFIGAFYDDDVTKAVNLARGEVPLGLMPVGPKP